MDQSTTYLALVATLPICFIVSRIISAWVTTYKLSHIPTVGPSSYFGSIKAFHDARMLLQEGYDKYHGHFFKIRMPDHWLVVASGPELLNDMRKAKNDELSFVKAADDVVQMRYTIGPEFLASRYDTKVVKGALTRSIQGRFADVKDEIEEAFKTEVPLSQEWTSLPVLPTLMRIVCRTTNRLFVGTPLCRDPDWIDLNIHFTVDVFKTAATINLFPEILKPIVGNLLSPTRRSRTRALRHLNPIIKDRLERLDRGEQCMENDLLSWLLDPSVNPGGEFRTVQDLIARVLHLNIAAIHTTSNTLTNTLFYLAVQSPSVIVELRQEVERTLKEHGWTKPAIGQMRKVDSFLKESARMLGLIGTSVHRKVLKPFTFSDGTSIPAGAEMAVSAWSLHHDDRNYTKPDVFEPFRFYKMRTQMDAGNESIKHQMITPDSDYVFFGTGSQACPGRFFAVNEMKTIFAHILLNYDVKLDPNTSSSFPEPTWSGIIINPDPKGRILFRKRRD